MASAVAAAQRSARRVPGVGRWSVVALALVLVALASFAELSYAVRQSDARDVSAYWDAAVRLREGQPLYAAGAPNDSDLYRYAPWFAYAWIPLTLLPRDAVVLAWMAVLVVAALASTAPLLRRGLVGVAAFALITPFQLEAAAYGNVQPLLVLMLLWGVGRRTGPLWIAVGASLKAVPLVLSVVYFARGEHRRGAAALALTALLVGPMLLFDLTGYSTEPGGGQLSLAAVWLPAFALGAVASVALAVRLARTRYGWLGGSLAMLGCLPRFLPYEMGFLLVAFAGERGRDGEGERADGQARPPAQGGV